MNPDYYDYLRNAEEFRRRQMQKNEKPIDVTVGGGSSQTNVQVDDQNVSASGPWGAITLPVKAVGWVLGGLWRLTFGRLFK